MLVSRVVLVVSTDEDSSINGQRDKVVGKWPVRRRHIRGHHRELVVNRDHHLSIISILSSQLHCRRKGIRVLERCRSALAA